VKLPAPHRSSRDGSSSKLSLEIGDEVGAQIALAPEKKLQWIEGTTARWDGYLELQRRPQPMLDWFAQHLS
jgi:hypothetical protein